ncbi:hypothetical protein B0H17DRAFT_1137485 [Mycena rosella]|uniref:Uncharacterized protein n=1 Tax=Mycena rosella TaxID=1033263 RepID=A0AAD7GES2_MYCRO|nr:hypothetical protein B0H17DRAFT_1137485 [Mycena rosella]
MPTKSLQTGVVRSVLRQLLVKPANLLNPNWLPKTSVFTFIRKRFRPAMYLLQSVAFGECSTAGETREVSVTEGEEIRWFIQLTLGTVRLVGRARHQVTIAPRSDSAAPHNFADYALPAQACRSFEILLVLSVRFPPQNPGQRLAHEIIRPVMIRFLCVCKATALSTSTPVDFPEYNENGQFHLFLGRNLEFSNPIMPPAIARANSKFTGRYTVHDEFPNLDFPSLASLHNFSLHPFMLRLATEHLDPMVQIFMRIRDEFSWNPQHKTEEEMVVMRHLIQAYYEHAVGFLSRGASAGETDPVPVLDPQEHVSDVIIRYKDLAVACRVPVPSVPWITLVMRTEKLYGYEGSEDAMQQMVMHGKVASLYQYANRFTGTRTVDEYVCICDPVVSILKQCCSFCRDPIQYSQDKGGLLRYIIEVLRSFAHALDCSIPATVFTADKLPRGRLDFIGAVVVEFITQASLVYNIAKQRTQATRERCFVESRARRTLSFALKFDRRTGSPSAGYSPSTRDFYIGRVREALDLASSYGPSAIRDIPLPLDIAFIPRVPPWNAREIDILLRSQDFTMWNVEHHLLAEEVATSAHLIQALERAEAYAELGYIAGTSNRTPM